MATSKDKIKERLGRSPDRLDAAMMATWAVDGNATGGVTKPDHLGWGS